MCKTTKAVYNKTAVTETIVNAAINNVKSYFNPLEHLLNDSIIDNGLEYFFS